jgi:hypothetical protein
MNNLKFLTSRTSVSSVFVVQYDRAGIWGEEWQVLTFRLTQLSGPIGIFKSIEVACEDNGQIDELCTAGNASLTLRMNPGQFGIVAFNLSLIDNSSALRTDGLQSLSSTLPFLVTVVPVNQPPEFDIRIIPFPLTVGEGTSCITRSAPPPGLDVMFLSRPSGAPWYSRPPRLNSKYCAKLASKPKHMNVDGEQIWNAWNILGAFTVTQAWL